MKYKVMQHGPNGELETVFLETDESYARLMAHAHIHSAEPVSNDDLPKYAKESSVGYTKGVITPTTKKK